MDEAEKRRIIRDAATIVLLRERKGNHQVLMGQRGSGAVFMPNKYVFPGGAVDKQDYDILPATPLNPIDEQRLSHMAPSGVASAIAMAAIRELWEETGLILGRQRSWPDSIPADWQDFASTGYRPSASGLQYVFRALTPPGRPRRFDARFFLVDADEIATDLDDFSRASDELSHLQWVKLSQARQFDLPFITEVVLAEVAARITDPTPPGSVPYFRNTDEASLFLRLYGKEMPATG